MSAPAIAIRRLSATAHLGASDDVGRIARLLSGVAERRLDGALGSVALPPGSWCLRRLEVPVRLDLSAPDAAVEEAWSAALAAAIISAVRDPGQAVRYVGMRDALADLIAGVAAGRLARAWAWQQLGLLPRGRPDPRSEPRTALLAAVSRQPQHAPGAVVLAVDKAGLAALHRALGAAGWDALARMVCGAAGHPLPLPPRAEPVPSAGVAAGPESAARLAARLVTSSRFAAAVRRSTIRPSPVTLHAWAVLAAADADPSVLNRGAAAAVIAEVAAALGARAGAIRHQGARVDREPSQATSGRGGAAPDVSGGGGAALAAGPQAGTRPGRGNGAPVRGAPDRPKMRAAEPATEEGPPALADRGADAVAQEAPVPAPARSAAGKPPPRAGSHSAPAGDQDPPGAVTHAREADQPGTDDHQHPTRYAGLLFLLATAPAAGVPECALEDPSLAARTLPWVLHGVAAGVGVPAGDPATAIFAGLDPSRRLPWAGDTPATQAELDGVARITRRWSLAIAAAMDGTGERAEEIVGGIVRRAGVISYTPGWVEVRMQLCDVDLDVRRAGLDLDPGWVPWLGTVVRFVYE